LIQDQTDRRKRYNWLYYTLAVAGAVTLVLQLAGKGKWFVGVMVMGTAALFWFSIWMHKKECEVYHRNIIKYRPPR
jgi:FtsH-binding integral membrane protein